MIRILSDIHIGHKASRVRSIEMLEPLFRETDQIILNGDTIEEKYANSPSRNEQPIPSVSETLETFQSWNPNTLALTGNHDPFISDQHCAFLDDGRILVTHGDAVFEEIAPWSRSVKHLQAAIAERTEGRPRQSFQFEDYLGRLKQAAFDAHNRDLSYDPTIWGKAKIFLKQAWPPERPLKILQSWRRSADQAAKLADDFGLSCRTIIVGHSHYPGLWKRGNRRIINTGSFFPWPGARCVDISATSLAFRQIVKKRGHYYPGKVLQTMDLPR